MFHRCLLMLVVAMSVLGCETTMPEKTASNTAKPPDAATNKYNLGYIVGYNELCAQFRGTGADDKILRMFKESFKGDKDFMRGYDQLSSYRVYDSLTGLHQCEEMREMLTNVHKGFLESLGVKT